MNSAYGKCIQKPIENSFVYKKYRTLVDRKVKGETKQVEEHPLDKYCFKNSAKIKEINQISRNMYQIKVCNSIADFATNTLLGVQILSMSKRIMNEVMCTAEDLGIEIFYQDTDSMHI
jgi:ribosomal protein S8